MNPIELREACKSAFQNYTSLDMTTPEWRDSPDRCKWNQSDEKIKEFILKHNLCLTFVPLEQLGKTKRIFLIKKKSLISKVIKALQKVIDQKATRCDAEKAQSEFRSRVFSGGIVKSASASVIGGESDSKSRTTKREKPKKSESKISVSPARKERRSKTHSKSLVTHYDGSTSSESVSQENNLKKSVLHKKASLLIKSQSLAEIAPEKHNSRNSLN